MKTPREALADTRIRAHQCRNALAEALRTERLAEAAVRAAEEAERAPTVRPPPPPPCPAGCEQGTIYAHGGPFNCDACDGGWE